MVRSCSNCYLLHLWKSPSLIFNVWNQNWLPILVAPKPCLFWHCSSERLWNTASNHGQPWCAPQHQYGAMWTPVSVPCYCWHWMCV